MGGPTACVSGLPWGEVVAFSEWVMKSMSCLHWGCHVPLDPEMRLFSFNKQRDGLQGHLRSGGFCGSRGQIPLSEGPLLGLLFCEMSPDHCRLPLPQVETDYCLLLALPCGRDQEDVVSQTESLKAAFITYLQAKQAAGIINVPNPGSNQVSPGSFLGKHTRLIW